VRTVGSGFDRPAPRRYDGFVVAATRRPLTLADLARTPDDGNRYEILEGALRMTPLPATAHQLLVSRIAALLDAGVRRRRAGWVFVDVGVRLTRFSILVPDVVFLRRSRRRRIRKTLIDGAPDLVVEVRSPATAAVDRGRKLRLYRERGVSEYWIVDPARRTLEVHSFATGRPVRTLREGSELRPSVLPGLRLRVRDVFSALD
jgi:Uma2 family endonuclease